MKPDPFRDQPIVATWDSAHAPLTRHDCFADEIAVDFPSEGHFVQRVRDAFLADVLREQTATLKTEVRVSRAEAHRGTVLPLDVPLRCTCPACGGRGESWSERCVTCRGTGSALVHSRFRVPLPPGVANGARFRFRACVAHDSPVRIEVTVAIAGGG